MLIYPVNLFHDDNGTVMVTFPDVPEAVTYGDTEGDARPHAVDALEVMFMAYMDDRKPIPLPSAPRGRATIALSCLTSAKIMLYNAMIEDGVTKSELTRRLKCHPPQVDRLLDLNHASRLDQLENALAALGRRLFVEVQKAA